MATRKTTRTIGCCLVAAALALAPAGLKAQEDTHAAPATQTEGTAQAGTAAQAGAQATQTAEEPLDAAAQAELQKRRESWTKLQTWKRGLFVGASLPVNLAFADNITDHPVFRYSDALGLGVDVQVGKYFSPKFGARLGISHHNVKNRVDYETVRGWRAWGVYTKDSHGFFRFGVTELYADALFDISGVATSNKFHPLHVMWVTGLGVVFSGKKEMKEDFVLPGLDPERKYYPVRVDEEDAAWFRSVSGDKLPTFEGRVNPKSRTLLALRLGLLFDYRVSRRLSLSLEGTADFMNDNFEGIKFDEPFDILLKGSLGAKYWF